MAINKLYRELETNLNRSSSTIISICGAADLGKSYLSKQLEALFSKQGLRAGHLTLDSYLMSRNERKKKGWSGYHVEAYDLVEASNCLIKVKKQQSIRFRPYRHQDGNKGNSFVEINPVDILIFDGLHTMHPIFMPYIDLSVFIYTEDESLKRIRSESDVTKRNYTVDYSNEISQREFDLYKKYIEPYKNRSDYLLFFEKQWDYIFTKNEGQHDG